MVTLKDFEQGATYPPVVDASRLSRITANRKLYNNDLKPHIEVTDDTNSVRINLFRKSIEIYTNFLLSEGVKIDFKSADKDAFKDRINHLLDVLYLVNTDSKRYGVGVVSIDQQTGLFKVFEPDQWYQLKGEEGSLIGEVLVEYSNNTLEIPKDEDHNSNNFALITIIANNYLTSLQTKTVRKLKGGKIGDQVGKVITLKIVGRQIAPLYSGYPKGQEGVSVFDDIKDVIFDMIRIRQNLSKSLERNSSPHLAAPAGILSDNPEGGITINTKGMLFPMNPGDEKPSYLQWDTKVEAAKFQTDEHWKAYFALTSIPRMLFEPTTGATSSGEALKRMLFPFLSALAKLKTANLVLIRQLLVLYDNHLLINGLPRLHTTTPDIFLDYDKIFEDTNTTPTISEVKQ